MLMHLLDQHRERVTGEGRGVAAGPVGGGTQRWEGGGEGAVRVPPRPPPGEDATRGALGTGPKAEQVRVDRRLCLFMLHVHPSPHSGCVCLDSIEKKIFVQKRFVRLTLPPTLRSDLNVYKEF